MFAIYNGRTDSMEYVSQFNQRMIIHSRNEVLMCKVFPSNLEPVAMRWFNSLKTDSIDSYKQLTQAFGSFFITNSRVSLPLSSLLSLSMREGETLKHTRTDIGKCTMRWTVTMTMSPSACLKVVSPPSIVWGNPWLVSLLLVSVNLWTGLTNTKAWKRTNCKGKEKRRSSPTRGMISGQNDTTITIRGEISQGNLDQPTRKWLTSYSENWYNRFWRKSRMSRFSSGQIRWPETSQSVTRVCIVSTTKTTNILSKTAGTYGTTWISWSEKGNCGTFYILPVVIWVRQTKSPWETYL